MSQREQTRLATAAAEELPYAQPHLHGIDSRIWRRQPSVRDMHVTQFQTYIVLRAENMHAERGLGDEIYGVSPSGYIVIGEERAAAEFEVRREATVAFEVPLEAKRIEAYAVRGIRWLEDEEDGDGVDSVLKTSAKKTGQVRSSEDPSIAEAQVEDASIASSATHGMTAARPDLDLMAALFRAGLGEGERRCHQQSREERKGRAHKRSAWRMKGSAEELRYRKRLCADKRKA